MTDRTHSAPGGSGGSPLHRLLDEAFAGVTMTPDAQDLKEEVRANLLARAAELEAGGASPVDAARRAVEELGDVRDLLDGTAPDGAAREGAGPGRAGLDGLTAGAAAPAALPTVESPADAHRRHRVRPRPAFVVRTVLLALVATAGLVLGALVAAGEPAVGALVGLGAAVAIALGIVTADALRQETTTNHPMPTGRALGYGSATGAALAGLALAGTFLLHRDATWAAVLAAVALVAAAAAFSWLGATQTNRHKAWVRRTNAAAEPPNRFEEEPETAARFGMYTAAIWVVTLAAVVALGLTVGWWWAVLGLVGGLAVTMLTLARMLFGPRRGS